MDYSALITNTTLQRKFGISIEEILDEVAHGEQLNALRNSPNREMVINALLNQNSATETSVWLSKRVQRLISCLRNKIVSLLGRPDWMTTAAKIEHLIGELNIEERPLHIERIHDRKFRVVTEEGPCIVRLKTTLPINEAQKVIKTLFATQTLQGRVRIDNHTPKYKFVEHNSFLKSLLCKISSAFSIATPTEFALKEHSRTGLHLRSRFIRIETPKALHIIEGFANRGEADLIEGLFLDPFTKVAKIAFQEVVENFSQADLTTSPDTSLRISLKGSNLHLEKVLNENSDEGDTEALDAYKNYINKTFGKARVQRAEKLANRPLVEERHLTPELIYRMNVCLTVVGEQEIGNKLKMLQTLAQEITSEPEKNLFNYIKEDSTFSPADWCPILRAIHATKNSTVQELQEWLNSEKIAEILAKESSRDLEPNQFQTLVDLTRFSNEEIENHYTGRKVPYLLSGYGIAGKKVFKPWLTRQEMDQAIQECRNAKTNEEYTEILAHIVCKLHPLFYNGENFVLDTLIPAPPEQRGEHEQWYRISSFISNGLGSVSTTLEPACKNNGLPAIKLYRSTAHSAYSFDGWASVQNDTNPLNAPGYEGNILLDPYESDFFNKRTIPFYEGYRILAEKEIEQKNWDSAKALLKQAFSSIEEDPKKERLDLDRIVTKFDFTILELFAKSGTFSRSERRALDRFIKKAAIRDEFSSEEKQNSLRMLSELANKALRAMEATNAPDPISIRTLQLLKTVTTLALNNSESELSSKFIEVKDYQNTLNETDVTPDKISELHQWLADYAIAAGEHNDLKIKEPVWIIGHSLGGALTQERTARLISSGRMPLPDNKMGVYHFAAPKINGEDNECFVKTLAKHANLLEAHHTGVKITSRLGEGDFIVLGGGGKRGGEHLGTPVASEGETEIEDAFDRVCEFDMQTYTINKDSKNTVFPAVHGQRIHAAEPDYERCFVERQTLQSVPIETIAKCDLISRKIAAFEHNSAYIRRCVRSRDNEHLGENSPLYGPWRESRDSYGVFAIKDGRVVSNTLSS